MPKTKKGIKKVMNGGSLRMYPDFLDAHIKNKSKFKVVSSGLSKIVVFDNGIKFRFFGNGSSSKIEGAYFVSIVKKQIDNYISKYGVVPIKDKRTIQSFNPEAIQNYIGKPVTCLDLNLCYWRTAYLLKFIDEKTYNKGLESGHKKGMLVSIGALNKLPIIEYYEKGKAISQTYDTEVNSKYSPFYWAIICKVRDLMMEVYKEIGDDLYMWLTDCAFIHPDKEKQVTELFSKYGFPYKKYVSDFMDCTNYDVIWFDCKANKVKSMSISNRLLKKQYNRWKYTKSFYSKNTLLKND